MYANKMTDSMKAAIDETDRRRKIQQDHNEKHGIEPKTIIKSIRDLTARVQAMMEQDTMSDMPEGVKEVSLTGLPPDKMHKMIKELDAEMKRAAKSLEFEKAAALRDQIFELRGVLALEKGSDDNLLISS